MHPICVVYHCILSGGSVPIDTEIACRILHDQMRALKDSGLLDAADEFHVGVNGGHEDAEIVRMFSPCLKVDIREHGPGATSEIPTLKWLREWLPAHSDWYVLYHHMKSITHPTDPFYARWRQRMEKHVVWNWRACVAQLDHGVDACGCHWLTPEQFPSVHNCPFFGGTFYWATAKFLLTLPPLPEPTWANRFEAENWIGRGPRRPRIMDFHPGWPA
jgi:hypothetical protein